MFASDLVQCFQCETHAIVLIDCEESNLEMGSPKCICYLQGIRILERFKWGLAQKKSLETLVYYEERPHKVFENSYGTFSGTFV